jgi:hypothetical protein
LSEAQKGVGLLRGLPVKGKRHAKVVNCILFYKFVFALLALLVM